MNKFVFLDTETTGNDFYLDRLFEVAYKFGEKTYAEYFKPPLPITIKSQSITHVTNEMVEDKPNFYDSEMKKDLEKILSENILVAHSAEFDIDMLAKEGVNTPRFICTLKVARHLDPDSEVPEYGLQFLRYFHKLNVDDAGAHDAKSDIKVLEALFYYLFEKMKKTGMEDEEIIEEMERISKEPLLIKIFPFGKHKGKKLEDVYVADKGYLEWMLEQKLMEDNVQEDWIFSLKYFLQIKD